MRARAEYAEYLAEVRERVCSRCAERVPGHPPLTPACRRCGVELQLPQLVQSIHEAESELPEFGPLPDRRLVCARCICLDGGRCPCAAASWTDLLVQAVRAVDERHEQRDVLKRYLARQPRPARVPIVQMIEAYEAATQTCISCD